MTENVKKLAPQILAEIKKSRRVLLHCHPSPDPDSVGGALAMMFALQVMDKEVTVIKGDSELPTAFACLPGYEQIVPKNITEIDLSQFDLFIIQDSGSPKMVTRLVPLNFPPSLNTIIIDHHNSNDKFAKINLVDESYPANCQQLYDLFTLWKVKITPEIAINLFAGISTDTGGFKYRGVTKETFEIATALVEIAPNFSEIISKIENSNSPKQLWYESAMLGSATSYFNGRVGMANIPFSWFQDKKINPEDIAKSDFLPNRLLSVAQWDVVVTMKEEKQNEIKMSFRSKNPDIYDVSKITSLLGGGGHKAASGLYLKMSLDEARQKVLEAIATTYPALGKA